MGWQAPALQWAGDFVILGITAVGRRGGPVVCKEEWGIGMLRILLDSRPISSEIFPILFPIVRTCLYKYTLERQWERRPSHNKLLIVEFFCCCCCCRPQILNSLSILADPRWLQDRSHSLHELASVKKTENGKGTVQGSEPP